MHRTLHRRRVFLGLATLLPLASVVWAEGTVDAAAPEAVVMTLMEAMRANDADAIRAVFAETASQAYGNGAAKTGADFANWLQSDIIDRHGQVDDPQITATGEEVVVTGEYRNNVGYRSPADFLFRVMGGKIVSWQMRY